MSTESLLNKQEDTPWWKLVNRQQWLVLLVAWLGWMFDLMDATLYSLVVFPALQDLLGEGATVQDIGWHGGLIFAIFLIGWALGGIFFGIFADYYGRKTTLMVTILMYSVFTGLSALSGSWWEFGIYRFLTGLGVGGEWSAGASLVAESWPEKARAKGAAILQSAAGAGYFLAALINLLVGAYSWRYVFLIGALPAVVVLLVRFMVKESDRWLESQKEIAKQEATETTDGKKRRPLTLVLLFSRQLRRDTIVGAALAIIVTLGFWGVTSWVPALIRDLLSRDGMDPARANSLVSYASMALNVGSIFGYLVFGVVADRWGRKPAFAIYFLGAVIITPVTFLMGWSLSAMFLLLPILGFFTMGIFSGFPLYLPELFPTHLRATGAGFCFNIGRTVAAAGPLLTGALISTSGSFAIAVSVLSGVYLLGPIVLLFARETKGKPLQ